MSKRHGVYEITEDEFDEFNWGRDDSILLEYDEYTGIICEDGYSDLDEEDINLIGKTFIDDFIDSGKDIAWGRNDATDTNYEITRWNSKKK